MRPRFQADADLRVDILEGVIREEPSVDFRLADEAGLRGKHDNIVLQIAAGQDRILVSHDRRSMPSHFAKFIAKNKSSGVIIIAQNVSTRRAIEILLEKWHDTAHAEWINRIADLS